MRGVLAPLGAPAGGGGAHPSRIVSGLWGADDVDKTLVTGMIAIRMLLQDMCTASSVGKSSQSVHSNMGSICSGVNFFFSAGLRQCKQHPCLDSVKGSVIKVLIYMESLLHHWQGHPPAAFSSPLLAADH